MRDELEVKDNAIANLQNQLIGVVSELEAVTLELKEREVAIATLKSELDAREDKQLSNPDTIKTVSGTSDRLTVGTPGLVKYINSIDPDSGIIAKTINNAITRHKGGEGEGGQGRSLASLESTYNFKYLGQNGRNHQFSIPKL
ncbi:MULTISPECIES: hypothetical protein [Planktothrix]|uniref:Uncharacterized protein n=1 Tax=Planktothrix rubescens CCAP 1459/22 TaxID=329571 RepID=A0A6J7ZFG9_PLARU|nr:MULTISPECIES: hypothetical protein [Planktothrix]CAC5339847.1 protein of unknown function [Planktothrix rubescens NIVA-CYA 18]CAD5986713.1 hypothetical protein PCC7821_05139 [Planktothrix rubescens NIVA-CYA 18]